MLLVGDNVQVQYIETTDPEDEHYLTLHKGKTGVITAVKGNSYEVKLNGLDRLTYFYSHELSKVKK